MGDADPDRGLALVTGASGFVGSHLVAALAGAGWRVRALVRPRSERRWLDGIPGVACAVGDVTEPATLPAALDGATRVDHCAGVTTARRRRDFFRVNTGGTRHLLEACLRRRGTPPRVVLVSSQAAAGPTPDGAPLDETAPCRPITAYGASKAAAEQVARTFGDRIPLTIVRPPSVYGPRDRATLDFFKLVVGGLVPRRGRPDPRLALVHVRDLVDGIVRAGTVPDAVGRTYFLANPEPVRWTPLFEGIRAALGSPRVRPIPFQRGTLWLAALVQELIAMARGRVPPLTRERLAEFLAPAWVCSSAAAARDLGWRATIPVAEGLRETVAWYRAEGWL